jgi:hypothetical protein
MKKLISIITFLTLLSGCLPIDCYQIAKTIQNIYEESSIAHEREP